jgi:hypothetical protein
MPYIWHLQFKAQPKFCVSAKVCPWNRMKRVSYFYAGIGCVYAHANASYESQLPNINSAQTTFKQKIKQSLGTSLFQQTL